jgi:formylglycine-generating enzyme required for sulfatase activity
MPLIQHRETRTAQYYTEILDNRTPLDMVLIPGGSFSMGSPDDESERRDTEGPQHVVTVPSFFMARYPITQAQWRSVAALPKADRDLNPDLSRFKGDQHPVEQVSWHEATEFCRRLAAQTSRPYRLPSEAEWEYACRAGTTTPFYFGRTITPELANYRGTSTYNDGPKGEYREETTPVDQFGIANAFGLCDMHGNVWEWCQDHWHGNYEGAPVDGSAWVDPEASEDADRVLRGGSWLYDPRYCRSATRNHDAAGDRDDYGLGFRVVCVAPRTL